MLAATAPLAEHFGTIDLTRPWQRIRVLLEMCAGRSAAMIQPRLPCSRCFTSARLAVRKARSGIRVVHRARLARRLPSGAAADVSAAAEQ
jgi:hypothetical protein